MQPSVILSDFTPMRVSKEIPQEKLLEETANIFALTQCAIQQPKSQEAADRILAETREMVQHYGVSSGYINQREFNSMLDVRIIGGEDDTYPDVIPRPLQQPRGLPIHRRMEIFRKIAVNLLETHYAGCDQAPDDLIHVSATGYMSPSPVQQFVARNNWNNTIITHSYHMGCYGAFPAVTTAHGRMSTSYALNRPKSRIDIFHTEYASLHLDCYKLIPHKIVSMTLFGDGFICYSAFSQNSFDAGEKSGLKILSIDERVLPDSEKEMTLDLEPNHYVMYLAPTVPDFIGEYMQEFVEDLLARAGYELSEIKDDLIFAAHPGGPKILDRIQERLDITREQIQYSWNVLYEKGNMASVSVPYIWHAITNDETVPKGKLVVSLGFGPGLTACGMLMEKV
uniref:Predicted naringenin-chalcone synthase n=1 Tax=Candidatus Kentrum eta TaxID=2126337 RepID=A0A450V2I2_9GAMM|nr:MAG: Predicted naringenin-chalcone synthase [Candidatus Kentron sp. H]VFJ99214.1 MAG: Predicted naringenin-chalcone synthase [Candidatus Kentron sp. H]VFK03865.1 MAG: Predicted naringenin-chalcone synthase [Candidatus Kentron sp. H]